MSAKILTGYTGERHITPLDDAAVYRMIFGPGEYILYGDDRCGGSMPSNNEFVVSDGHLSIQGVQVRISAETLSVDTCATGKVRIDLVVARWTHDPTSLIDNVELAVLKGAEVSDSNTPVAPSYNTGDIDEGATAVDMPLYRIDLAGGSVTFTRVAKVIPGINGLVTVVVNVPSFSSLPLTITDERIVREHGVQNSVLSNPSAQTSDWSVAPTDGSITISGSINGTTSLELHMAFCDTKDEEE